MVDKVATIIFIQCTIRDPTHNEYMTACNLGKSPEAMLSRIYQQLLKQALEKIN